MQEIKRRRGGQLPPVLYLQMDNCARENKNKAMLGYLSWLVEKGVFNKVVLGFLPVGYAPLRFLLRVSEGHGLSCTFLSIIFGSVWKLTVGTKHVNPVRRCFPRDPRCRHTHFGVDQVFSRHSVYLRKTDALTLPDLKRALVDSYRMPDCEIPGVLVFELEEAADVSAWIKPHLDASIVGVTEPHQFMFVKKKVTVSAADGSGEVQVERCVVDHKLWSVSSEWLPGLLVLKVGHPTACPPYVCVCSKLTWHSACCCKLHKIPRLVA